MKEKSRWELTPEEWRTLVITFIGGLASIVVGACVIGAALAFSRWWNHGNTIKNWPVSVWLTISCPAASAVIFYFWKKNKKQRLLFGLMVLNVLLSTLILLVWIGIAAGVK